LPVGVSSRKRRQPSFVYELVRYKIDYRLLDYYELKEATMLELAIWKLGSSSRVMHRIDIPGPVNLKLDRY